MYLSLLLISFLTFETIEAEIFDVSEFGAYSNDQIDDAKNIQLAVDAAIAYDDNNNTVILNAGTYYLLSTIEIINATNLIIQGQGMSETLLIGSAPISIFYAMNCQGLKISNLSIDYSPRPFTAGYVVNVNHTYLDVNIEPPHTADVDRHVHSIFRYDPIEKRPAFGPNTYQIYQKVPHYGNTSLIAPNTLRIPIQYPMKFIVGDAIVATYFGQNHAIQLRFVTDGVLQSISLHASWYLGLLALRAKRLNITDYHTLARDGYWLSTNADCLHLTESSEYVNIFDTKCQSTGDDALAIHGVYFLVTELVNTTAMFMQIYNWTDPLDVGDRTILQFSSHMQPFTAYTRGIVASSVANSTNSRLFTFTSPMNVSVGDWACVADELTVTIRHYTAERTRGRGALLQTHNVNIQHSIFNRTSAPGILSFVSLYWHDGSPLINATFTNNLFINCNEGISQLKGIISFQSDPIQLKSIFNEIHIASSTFYFGSYSQGLLQSNNINNLVLNDNYIATNSTLPLVSICNSRNITAHNNTVVDYGGQIDHYYIFDDTSPCSMNLSSLIDLPPSAFNSSFLPPTLNV